MTRPDPGLIALELKAAMPMVLAHINQFNRKTFRTRGGRRGSGMGLLLEGLWGYFTTHELAGRGVEIAWLPDHQYNDFACVIDSAAWDPTTRSGELFRIEAKSMNADGEEAKAHFDELKRNIGNLDQLVVIVWKWEPDGERMWPKVYGIFIGPALPIAELRDKLHEMRGGSFVDGRHCPDDCVVRPCSHHGEPLNARGTRERVSGPESRRGSKRTSFAANFGGLVRMLKTRSKSAKKALDALTQTETTAREYIDFARAMNLDD
jgi:hypothetical protein